MGCIFNRGALYKLNIMIACCDVRMTKSVVRLILVRDLLCMNEATAVVLLALMSTALLTRVSA